MVVTFFCRASASDGLASAASVYATTSHGVGTHARMVAHPSRCCAGFFEAQSLAPVLEVRRRSCCCCFYCARSLTHRLHSHHDSVLLYTLGSVYYLIGAPRPQQRWHAKWYPFIGVAWLIPEILKKRQEVILREIKRCEWNTTEMCSFGSCACVSMSRERTARLCHSVV